MIKRYITEFMGYHYDVFEYVTKARLHAYPLCWRVFYVHLVLGQVGLFTMQNLCHRRVEERLRIMGGYILMK